MFKTGRLTRLDYSNACYCAIDCGAPVKILSVKILAAWLARRHLKLCVDKIEIAEELFDALIVHDPDAVRRRFTDEPGIYYDVLKQLRFISDP